MSTLRFLSNWTLERDGELFRTDDGQVSPYAPGHGDFLPAFRRSGTLQQLREAVAGFPPERVAERTGIPAPVIRDLARDGMTMLVVTHEMQFARDVGDRVVFMDEGRIVEQGEPSDVLDRPREERTRRFLRRSLQLAHSLDELEIDEGGAE